MIKFQMKWDSPHRLRGRMVIYASRWKLKRK